jgi:hypothetical protein
VHDLRLFSRKQSGEKDFIDAAAEVFATVNFHDGDTFVVALAERGICVDIDETWFMAMATKEREGVVAKVTAVTGV